MFTTTSELGAPGETRVRKITQKCREMTEKKNEETAPSAHKQQCLVKSANVVRKLDVSGVLDRCPRRGSGCRHSAMVERWSLCRVVTVQKRVNFSSFEFSVRM
jgi:hypothetical protein